MEPIYNKPKNADFEIIESPYLFCHEYCKENNVVVNEDEPEYELLDTQAIESLTVFNESGVEIEGMAKYHTKSTTEPP